ncbi:hypothetical protein H2248_002421 [Termitomyces sp. 'cryptogamus']|nr:hypothetical protein H2248_002421 [Termitomyces sp. 'cryptogamus']
MRLTGSDAVDGFGCGRRARIMMLGVDEGLELDLVVRDPPCPLPTSPTCPAFNHFPRLPIAHIGRSANDRHWCHLRQVDRRLIFLRRQETREGYSMPTDEQAGYERYVLGDKERKG